jgi:6-phosphogluconolactonase
MTTLYLGGYTADQPEGRSGLARVTLSGRGFGDAEPLAGPQDPSWLVRVGQGPDELVYAVAAGDQVVQVRPGQGVVASAPSGGMGPAHLALSPDGRWLVASNYVSGSIGLVRSGSPSAGRPVGNLGLADELQFSGDGPHERQDSPHAHQAVFLDERRILVCDLGSDRVREVTIEDGRLRHTADLVMPPGCGPRHLALAPGRDDLLWVVGELDQTVHTVTRQGGAWSVVQTVTTAPEGPGPGETTTGGIVVAPDGSHLYVSTRGTDTVSVFAAGDGGQLTLRQQVVTGHWPRFIGWLPGEEGRRLLVAAEKEGSVDVWAVDHGLLEETGHSLAWSAPTWVG